MDELAKSIQAKYIDDITSKYPIFRFLILFIFLIAAYGYSKKDSTGRFLLDSSKIKIKFLFAFSDGLLAEISLLQLVICIIATCATSLTYSRLKNAAFKILSKAANFDAYTKKIQNQIANQKSR